MLSKLIAIPVLLGSLTVASPVVAPDPPMHLDLQKSSPEADAMVHELGAIELWFTEEPQENSVSIRLTNSDGDLVETGEVTHGEEDASFGAVLTDDLTTGTYTVAWRAMGSDGHVVRGDFTFSFMTH